MPYFDLAISRSGFASVPARRVALFRWTLLSESWLASWKWRIRFGVSSVLDVTISARVDARQDALEGKQPGNA
jgi:hypothetical protein